MKSPEYYGAVGDGVTDDTQAWQDAIDSGEDVKAGSKKYKCGKLTVSANITIDCDGAEFLVTDSILFDCAGTVVKTVSGNDYTAYQRNYSTGDLFTGICFIEGTNNVFKERSYYKGGSVEAFDNGIMQTAIPVDIENPTIYELDTITVNIKNIDDVEFADETNALVVRVQYGRNCIFENINMSNVCYSVISLWQCYGCTYRDSAFEIDQYKEYGTNYYPISINDTCYTKILNINGYCEGWHCISTGNHTLCRRTLVDGCTLQTDYAVPAYGDHPNGIESIVQNTTTSSVLLGVLGKLINCKITRNRDYDMCRVMLDFSSIEGLAEHEVTGCEFYPTSSTYSSIMLYCSPQQSGYDYDYFYKKVVIKDCVNKGNVNMPLVKSTAWQITGETPVEETIVINSNVLNQVTAKIKANIFNI